MDTVITASGQGHLAMACLSGQGFKQDPGDCMTDQVQNRLAVRI